MEAFIAVIRYYDWYYMYHAMLPIGAPVVSTMFNWQYCQHTNNCLSNYGPESLIAFEGRRV